MTAITLNLLAEEKLAQEERARDPVKIFIAIGLVALVAVVGWASCLSVILTQKRAELHGLEMQWEKMNGFGEKEADFRRLRTLAEEIAGLNRSRVLFAPQLAMMKDLIPPSIQLSHLGFTLVVETPTSDAVDGDVPDGKHRARPKPVQRLMLRMEGSASSSRPELEVDQFLRMLRSDERFSAAVDDIQLRSISRSTNDSIDKDGHSVFAADFIIECRYKGVAVK